MAEQCFQKWITILVEWSVFWSRGTLILEAVALPTVPYIAGATLVRTDEGSYQVFVEMNLPCLIVCCFMYEHKDWSLVSVWVNLGRWSAMFDHFLFGHLFRDLTGVSACAFEVCLSTHPLIVSRLAPSFPNEGLLTVVNQHKGDLFLWVDWEPNEWVINMFIGSPKQRWNYWWQ